MKDNEAFRSIAQIMGIRDFVQINFETNKSAVVIDKSGTKHYENVDSILIMEHPIATLLNVNYQTEGGESFRALTVKDAQSITILDLEDNSYD